METRGNLSDKKPSGDKRTTRVYIWGKRDLWRKNSTCKGPGAELHLVGSRNSEGRPTWLESSEGGGEREEMRAERWAEAKCIGSSGS